MKTVKIHVFAAAIALALSAGAALAQEGGSTLPGGALSSRPEPA